MINPDLHGTESTRQSMSGLAKLGLNVEKNVWKIFNHKPVGE